VDEVVGQHAIDKHRNMIGTRTTHREVGALVVVGHNAGKRLRRSQDVTDQHHRSALQLRLVQAPF
jgi:hypothetical protein